ILLAHRRVAVPRVDDEAGGYGGRTGGARTAPGSDETAGPRRVPRSRLSALHTVSVRRAVSERLALPEGRVHGRRLLCVRLARDRRRGDGLPSSAVFRRLAVDAVAGERRRIYGVLRGVQDGGGAGLDEAAAQSRSRPMDRSGGLRRVSDAGRR